MNNLLNTDTLTDMPADPTKTVMVTRHPDLEPEPVDQGEFIQRELAARGFTKKSNPLIPVMQSVRTLNNSNLYEARAKALELATKTALHINLFEKHYPKGIEDILIDIEDVHKIADMNLKYLVGEK